MHSVSRPVRRLATVLTSLGLAALVAAGTVMAGTPVTDGWRDHAYGGGATRPSSDKPQSKLWYTDEGGGTVQWWGGMFYLGTPTQPRSEFRIFKLSPDKSTWTPTAAVADARDASHGDYLWDQAAGKLYVASVVNPNQSDPFAVPATADNVRVFRFSYSGGAWTALSGAGTGIPDTASTASPQFRGGAWTVSIDKDSTGRLWAVWPNGTQVWYSTSTDDGVTWAKASPLPAQGNNTINGGPGVTLSHSDTATVIGFGAGGTKSTIGVAWSDQDGKNDGQPDTTTNGYYFATIAAGADPASGGSWSTEKLPAPAGIGAAIYSDNHINIKATSDGTLYMVGKARTDTANCATLKDRFLTPFYRRATAGTWIVRLAGTVGDCETRPQLVIDEEMNPDVAYIFTTSPNGGGTIYRKAAPLSGPDAFDFRGGGNTGDTIVKRGVSFIRSSTETLIDDASTTKQVVTSDSGIAVIANNLPSAASSRKFYLHNYMGLPATDNTAPAGTVAINGGAGTTSSSAVTMTVTATDTGGSGMALVRLSNSSSVDANGVLDGAGSTSYTYTPSIAWTMTPGLGTQTVYAQWRDAAGNWSAVESDTITVTADSTPPGATGVPVHSICCSGATAFPIRVSWSPATDLESGIDHYEVWMSVNGAASTKVADTASTAYTLTATTSTRTYRFSVRAVNKATLFGPFRSGPTFRTISYSESSTAVKFSSGWGLSSSTAFVGGKAKYSVTAGRSASLTFIGNRVSWLSATGPNMGSARVYINGSLTATVNLYSATPVARKLVFGRTFSTSATRTIKIVVVGTAGHPRVILDQIYVMR